MSTGFRNPKPRIPDSTGQIFYRFRNPDSFTWGEVDSILYKWISRFKSVRIVSFWNQRKYHHYHQVSCCLPLTLKKMKSAFLGSELLIWLSSEAIPSWVCLLLGDKRQVVFCFIVSVGEYCSGIHKSSSRRIFRRRVLKQQFWCSQSG